MAARPAPAHADDGHELPSGWTLYDGGALLSPADYQGGAVPLELALDFFTGGVPAVRWHTSNTPVVTVCTHQFNRPGWLTAARYRQSVERAADVWNATETAVGLHYVGDCSSGSTWRADNFVNEIGWDDDRNFVRNPAAAVTQGSWQVLPGRRSFVEADIVIDHTLRVPEACLDSTVAHELGHVLGLGHSDVLGELMYPSFDSSNVTTCPSRPSTAEIAVLQSLYGVNRAPSIGASAQTTVAAGGPGSLSVNAVDPESDPLTYEWRQISGPTVSLGSQGASISFDVPNQVGETLAFEVRVLDRYRHSATATVRVEIVAGAVPSERPRQVPSLGSIRASSTGDMALRWSESAGADEYRFCYALVVGGPQTCRMQASPVVNVTWDIVIASATPGERERVLTTGTRATSMQACNGHGCSNPGVGPLAGGLRWSAHQVNYDYFAMSFDVPGSSVRFTIAGVTNVSGPARSFSLYSGTTSDYDAVRITSCGSVAAGETCIGLLTPSQRGHTSHVTIRSERADTPAIEHRIKVR